MSAYSQFKPGGGGSATIYAGTDTAVSTTTGIITIWNTSTLQSITNRGSTTTNRINISNTASAISTTSGALVVLGGVGVGGSVYAASMYADNALVVTTATVAQYAAITSITAGTDISVSPTSGAVVISDTSTFASVTARGSTSSQVIYLTNTTTSIRETTGALQIVGGVGIGKDVYIGNTLYVNTVTSVDLGSGVSLAPLSTTIFSGKNPISGSIHINNTVPQAVYVQGAGGFNASTSTNWTIEFWWYPENLGQGNGMFFTGRDSTYDLFYIGWANDGSFSIGYKSGISYTAVITATKAPTALAWHHIAVVNNGSTINAYIDGTFLSQAVNTIPAQSITQFCIGRWTGQNLYSLGTYYSNIRVVTNTAVYKGITPFIPPPAPLRVISGTQVLLNTVNGTNFLVDSSPNAYAVSNPNTATSSALVPFPITTEPTWTFDSAGEIVFPDSTVQASAWDPTHAIHITDATAATSISTGSLVVNGGIGVAGDIWTNGTIHGNIVGNNVILSAASLTESKITPVNTTATTRVDYFDVSIYRSSKSYIQIQDGSDFGVTEIVLLHDNSNNVYKSEYGIITTNGEKGVFTADISGGTVNLYFTANAASNKTITISRTALAI